MKWVFIALAGALLIGVAILLWIAIRIFFMAFFRRTPPYNPLYEPLSESIPKPYYGRFKLAHDWLLSENRHLRVMHIQSHDGLRLMGYLLPGRDQKKFVILIHGYHSSSLHDFGCAVKFYHRLGYSVLCTDMRAHGASEGRLICFGLKERYDAKAWAQELLRAYGDDISIFLHGLSMGATTVMMASALDLPANVKGIIADCGFTSPRDIVMYLMQRNYSVHFPPLIWALSLVFRVTSGYWLGSDSTLNAMKKCPLPMLFVHGGADDFVPTYMSEQNYQTCTAEKQLFIVDGAPHAISYLVDTRGYADRVTPFLQTHA
ncbi:alpha/beta hydrolase [Eubacteriales bacterium OttesenSCG-928-N13]|nr:alpha/beta hydrolase [Eubacteriales bacterium OttesenSCG-928-N13]